MCYGGAKNFKNDFYRRTLQDTNFYKSTTNQSVFFCSDRKAPIFSLTILVNTRIKIRTPALSLVLLSIFGGNLNFFQIFFDLKVFEFRLAIVIVEVLSKKDKDSNPIIFDRSCGSTDLFIFTFLTLF